MDWQPAEHEQGLAAGGRSPHAERDRLVGRALLVGLAAAVATVVAGVAMPAGHALDISGTWRGFPGTLVLVQKGTRLTGTFAMRIGCTETYRATGTLSGSRVRLELVRKAGPVDTRICAGTQTMQGQASASLLKLNLVNRHQASPATPYARVAR